MVRIRRKGPKRSEHVGMQKVANFTIVSTMVLIGLNIPPHNRLLYKLENYGIRGDPLKWIKAFLENLQQSVAVDGERSVFHVYIYKFSRGT